MGVIDGGHGRMGETVYIPMENEVIAAEICNPVFYDPEGGRVNG